MKKTAEQSILLNVAMKKRILIVMALMLIMFFAVLIRLFFLQVVQGDDLKAKGVEQQMGEVPVSANRGTIYDRNGNILAISVSVDSVYANPTEIDSDKAEAMAKKLSEVLNLDRDTVLTRLTSGRSYEWLKRKVSEEESAAVKSLDYQGIGITTETERNYPNGTLLCHLLGFAGIDNQGLEGLESQWDETLKGKDGYILSLYDSHSQEIPGSAEIYVDPKDGNSLTLTIDENIQYFCERELDTVMNSSIDPTGALAIVMNPKTGEILAYANRPDYDPNNYQKSDPSSWRNSGISDFYEPGSTAKILTLASALEEGAVTETDRFYDSGSISVGGVKINCWATRPHGSETLVQVAENSCNPAFVAVGQRIDAEDKMTFYNYLLKFGIGTKTGIGLSGESSGSLRNWESEEDVNVLDVANMYIGQGYGVTALQLITAVSATVNGGTLMKPYLVKEVVDSEGQSVEDYKPTKVATVISKETSKRLRAILESVVANGTGSNAYIKGYRVGGKTGTAQKFVNGSYSSTKYVASFIGFAPANDPQLICLVVINEPKGYPYYGGTIAAPVFKNIMNDALGYLGVKAQVTSSDKHKDDEEEPKMVKVPMVAGLSIDEAVKTLKEAGFKIITEQNGAGVVSQIPAAGEDVAYGSEIILQLSDKYDTLVTVPDLKGKRILECAELLEKLGLSLKPDGFGTAVKQSPAPGSTVKRGSLVTVKFTVNEDTQETIAP